METTGSNWQPPVKNQTLPIELRPESFDGWSGRAAMGLRSPGKLIVPMILANVVGLA